VAQAITQTLPPVSRAIDAVEKRSGKVQPMQL
jgi:hypothetical protein